MGQFFGPSEAYIVWPDLTDSLETFSILNYSVYGGFWSCDNFKDILTIMANPAKSLFGVKSTHVTWIVLLISLSANTFDVVAGLPSDLSSFQNSGLRSKSWGVRAGDLLHELTEEQTGRAKVDNMDDAVKIIVTQPAEFPDPAPVPVRPFVPGPHAAHDQEAKSSSSEAASEQARRTPQEEEERYLNKLIFNKLIG